MMIEIEVEMVNGQQLAWEDMDYISDTLAEVVESVPGVDSAYVTFHKE